MFWLRKSILGILQGFRTYAEVALMVEHLTCNQRVVGSTPAFGSNSNYSYIMAKPTAKVISYKEKKHTKHPGVHAKSKMSKNKTSKLYVKPYRGQGR